MMYKLIDIGQRGLPRLKTIGADDFSTFFAYADSVQLGKKHTI